MKRGPLVHSETQRDRLRVLLGSEAGVRERKMFGCPAFFFERRMVACVYGDEIGLKVPERRAEELLARGEVAKFQPYGKSMREWVSLSPRGSDAGLLPGLLREAVAYAKENAS